MRNRATDLLVLMLLAACGGAGNSTATAEAADSPAATAPMVESTTYLGPFAGEGAALHPDNVRPQPIAFYGTDLGFTYQHGEQLQILFGDSWATERYAPIEASTGSRFDDGFGTIDVRKGFDPASITPTSIPAIRLGQNPGTTEMSAIDPGHAMDLGKTPMAGFSNGTREFGVFNIGKPQGCTKDAECSNGLACDTTLGYFGSRYSQQENGTHRLSGWHARLHQRHDGRCGEQARSVERAVHGPNEPAAQRAGVEPAERHRHPGTDRRAR